MIENKELYRKLEDLITADWYPGTKLDKKHFQLRSTVLSKIYRKQLNDDKVEAKFWINSADKPDRLDFELSGGDVKYATAKKDIVEFLCGHFVDGDKPDALEGLFRNKNCKTKVVHIDLPTDIERRVEIIRACIKYFDRKIKEINKDYHGVINYAGDDDLLERAKKTVEINHTPKAIDLNSGEEKPGTSKQEIYRVLRDSTLARQIKLLHGNCCQICSTTMKLQGNKLYSEAHHIIPLGEPHNGPDKADNLIVLCPNCHVLCDYGANSLDLSNIKQVDNHQISQKSIDYHNTKIVGSNL
jgi:5-methylcytosine-specific restriction endonuclease McrA